MITEILLGIIVVLLIVLILLFLKRGRVELKDVESAISNVWIKSGLDEKIGMLTTYAKDIRDDYRSLEQMLRVPTERASLGEIALETVLSDQLPPDMFGIRERILDGKTPDANIKSTVGIICIDSKFPLDNYRKMIEVEDPKEKEGFKKQFLKDVQGHLNKIADDYVCPEKGSAEFAFAFIPSEGIYYFLVNEAYETFQRYTTKGVQVVSPLTLSHKIELIKAGVHAKKLSEQAEKVRRDITKLSQRFSDIDEKWRVFYETHLRNAGRKADELDEAYKKLREEFDRISKLSEEE
ncbi:MAG: DNA recombination protein RmuC [archaeon]|nr:DNA recombination protein RmuC [archaeon]